MVSFNVNFIRYTSDEKGNLLDFLRNKGFMGTKGGCRTGHCGSCTVLINKNPQKACISLLKNLNNAEIITIEAVALIPELLIISRVFVDEFAVQCGFCTPGMVMRTYALFLSKPDGKWSKELINDYFNENICRCTGYASIVRAVQRAGTELSKGIESLCFDENVRPDVLEKATGIAMFAEDFRLPNMLHVAIARIPAVSAIIKEINIEEAQNIEGVVSIITAKDIPGELYQGIIVKDQPVLADKIVRYYGEPIVAIAGETIDIARSAVKKVKIIYEEIKCVTSPEEALVSDNIHQNSPKNILKEYHLEHGIVENEFKNAFLVIEKEFTTQFIEHAYLEPECAFAIPEPEGKIRVITGVQNVYHSRHSVASVLNEPESNFICSLASIGGAFGGKEDIVCDSIAALICRKTNRPVRFALSRKESLMTTVKRHPFKIKAKAGFDKNGKILAQSMDITGDTGAYASIGDVVMLRALTQCTGPYEVPAFNLTSRAVYTNNVPTGAMRGFGVPQVCFAIETIMSIASEKLNISEFDIRRINGVKEGSVIAIGQKLESGTAFIETLDRTEQILIEKLAFWKNKFPKDTIEWGIASGFKNTGLGNASPVDYSEVSLTLHKNGKWEIGCGASECGQGVMGVLRQILMEITGSPVECIIVFNADTQNTPDSGVTSASRQTFMSGNALLCCAEEILRELSLIADSLINSEEDWFYSEHGVRSLNGEHFSFAEILQQSNRENINSTIKYSPPKTFSISDNNFVENKPVHNTFSFITQGVICRKEDNNKPQILEIISVQDIGRVIHQKLAQGQVEGGIVMGLGFALKEDFKISNGIPQTLTFRSINLPVFRDCPEMSIEFIDSRDSSTPLQSKGIGELTLIPTAPAVLNAYSKFGIERVYNLPAGK